MERLHRSKRNKVLFGVCGGLSEYLRIDVTLIRIVGILAVFTGFGIVLYIAAALIMPEDKGYTPDESQWNTDAGSYKNTGAESNAGFESEFNANAEEWNRPAKYHSEKNRVVIGAILLGLGILILGKQFMPGLFDLKLMVPLLLIVIGGIFVLRGRK